jgi:hypothetical protein
MLDSANIPFQSSGDWLSFSDFILAIYQPQVGHMTNLGTGSSLFCNMGFFMALSRFAQSSPASTMGSINVQLALPASCGNGLNRIRALLAPAYGRR